MVGSELQYRGSCFIYLHTSYPRLFLYVLKVLKDNSKCLFSLAGKNSLCCNIVKYKNGEMLSSPKKTSELPQKQQHFGKSAL